MESSLTETGYINDAERLKLIQTAISTFGLENTLSLPSAPTPGLSKKSLGILRSRLQSFLSIVSLLETS